MKKVILAAFLTVGLAGTAMANQCPKLMAEVDAALAAGPKISAEQMAEVTKLRAQGEAEHTAGKHAESVDTLNKAKAILGLQ